MTLDQCLVQLQNTYDIVGQIDLDQIIPLPFHERTGWINRQLIGLHQDQYSNNRFSDQMIRSFEVCDFLIVFK